MTQGDALGYHITAALRLRTTSYRHPVALEMKCYFRPFEGLKPLIHPYDFANN